MKPAFIRRFRRRAGASRSEGAFFKKESQETFFGNAEQQSFFSHSPSVAVNTGQSIQRKCEDCEKEDKEVQRQPEKKEEEKVMRAVEDKEEEKVQRAPEEKKEEEQVQRAPEEKKEEEKVQRAAEEKKEEEKVVQKKESTVAASPGKSTGSYISTISGKGQPLPAAANYFFSSRMGQDFSNVKIHKDKEAAKSAKDIRAKAYTIGNNIVFNEGYNMESEEGKKLMAHELTHVIQQKGGRKIQRRPARTPVTARPPQTRYDTGPHYGPTLDPNVRGPRYAPDSNSNDIDNLVQMKARENKREWKKAQMEMPVLSTGTGGEPPGFITEDVGGYYEDHQIGRVYYTRRKFHLLAKIDYDFSKANDIHGLQAVWNYYQDWFINTAKFCKEGEPDFDPIIYSKYMMYQVPVDINVMQVRRHVVDALQKRLQVIKEQQHKLNVLKVLKEAEDFALQGRSRDQGACHTRLVGRKGGNPLHNEYANYIAKEKGVPFHRINAETEVTTPEGVSYTFDVLNSKTNQAYEVKTRHLWAGDVGIGGTMYWPGFMDRVMKADFQRLKGLYVANRCSLDFRYVFDTCEAALGMRKQWSNIPPIEYIPPKGEPKEKCQ